MPGEPIINSAGGPAASDPSSPLGEGMATMARMADAGADMDLEGTDEESIAPLRMLFEERARSVPQPPMLMPRRERRMRRPL
jgi:hypothetical protein